MQPNEALRRSPALSEAIADQLTNDIAFGQIALGAVLSENKLGERFGTSKTPVREALLRLQAFGLVEVLPQRGARVFLPDRKAVRDISNFRLLLETGSLREIEPDAFAGLGIDLAEIVRKMESVFSLDDPRAYQVLDHAFHLAIVERAGNGLLSEAYARIGAKISALRTHLSTPQSFLLEKSLDEHREIAARLMAGQTDHITHILSDHIRRTSEFHQKIISSRLLGQEPVMERGTPIEESTSNRPG